MKFGRMIKWYKTTLDRRPYLMQAVQTGVLMGTGDLISQTVIEHKTLKEINVKRTLQFSSLGLFFCGPALRYWYGVLNKYIGAEGKTVVLKKVFADQAIFAPNFLAVCLAAIGTIQGKRWEVVKEDIKSDYFDILKVNYCVWPWVQLVNFNFVPLQYQVLLVQFVALFWNTYFSWKINKNKVKHV